jgi:hypothetical protein
VSPEEDYAEGTAAVSIIKSLALTVAFVWVPGGALLWWWL